MKMIVSIFDNIQEFDEELMKHETDKFYSSAEWDSDMSDNQEPVYCSVHGLDFDGLCAHIDKKMTRNFKAYLTDTGIIFVELY